MGHPYIRFWKFFGITVLFGTVCLMNVILAPRPWYALAIIAGGVAFGTWMRVLVAFYRYFRHFIETNERQPLFGDLHAPEATERHDASGVDVLLNGSVRWKFWIAMRILPFPKLHWIAPYLGFVRRVNVDSKERRVPVWMTDVKEGIALLKQREVRFGSEGKSYHWEAMVMEIPDDCPGCPNCQPEGGDPMEAMGRLVEGLSGVLGMMKAMPSLDWRTSEATPEPNQWGVITDGTLFALAQWKSDLVMGGETVAAGFWDYQRALTGGVGEVPGKVWTHWMPMDDLIGTLTHLLEADKQIEATAKEAVEAVGVGNA